MTVVLRPREGSTNAQASRIEHRENRDPGHRANFFGSRRPDRIETLPGTPVRFGFASARRSFKEVQFDTALLRTQPRPERSERPVSIAYQPLIVIPYR